MQVCKSFARRDIKINFVGSDGFLWHHPVRNVPPSLSTFLYTFFMSLVLVSYSSILSKPLLLTQLIVVHKLRLSFGLYVCRFLLIESADSEEFWIAFQRMCTQSMRRFLEVLTPFSEQWCTCPLLSLLLLCQPRCSFLPFCPLVPYFTC